MSSVRDILVREIAQTHPAETAGQTADRLIDAIGLHEEYAFNHNRSRRQFHDEDDTCDLYDNRDEFLEEFEEYGDSGIREVRYCTDWEVL